MSGIRFNTSVLNQKATPALNSNTLANRPTAGYAGRIFFSTDTGQIFEDTGSTWTLLADAGVGGGSLETVTTNGNTTDKGIIITANGLSSNSVTIPTLTTGSVVFSGTSNQLQQDNANLFYDDTNNRLGLGTTTPGTPLDIHSTQNNILSLNNVSTGSSYILFQQNNTSLFKIGYTNGTTSFDITNVGTLTNPISINATTNITTFTGYTQLLQGISLGQPSGVGSNSTTINFYSQSGTYRYDAKVDASGNFQLAANGTATNLLISQAGLTTITSGIGVNGYAPSVSYAALFNGSVGIGTSSPAGILSVKGANNAGISLDQGNYNYYGAYTHVFSNSGYGTEYLRISNTGNLLVNTSTDAGYKLDIFGTGRFTGRLTSYGTIISTNTTGSESGYQYSDRSTGVTWLNYAQSGNTYFYNSTNGIVVYFSQAGAATFTGSIAIGNTVTASVNNVVTNKVAIVINGTQYYLLASTSSI